MTLQMLEKLADGTAAEIFRARDGADQVLVELTRPALSQDIDMYGRFLDEARERQKLTHPGLIRRRHTGCQNDGRLFVVTEALDGTTLAERLKRGPLTLKEATRIATGICEPLMYLHERGIVHGNLRPSTVYLTGTAAEPTPKLLDMGLLLFRTTRSLKAPRAMVLVSPEYLSPERARGKRADILTDVYGLGILLFEMISGRAPFVGDSSENTRQLHVSGSVPSVPQGFEPLAHVIALCLAKERGDRFHSVRAVREALLHVLLEAPQTQSVAVSSPTRSMRATTSLVTSATILGNYELLEQLGQGGMGQVYLARHRALDRQVAIKVLRPELATVDLHVTRFLQEARAVNMVKHPHIVEIQDFIDERRSGHVWCVMEYLRGPTLKQVIKEGPLPVTRALNIARQVAQALGAAHHVGVVHRDVKPENIMLVPDQGTDFVKVLDFGIAKLRDEAERVEHPKTGQGEIIGTPAYMSPEQAQALEIDERTDVYSLGTVLYLMLAGRLPFDGSGLVQLAMSLVSLPPRPLPPVGCSGEVLPPGLIELVHRCLEKTPSRRFASMQELDAALGAFEEEQIDLSDLIDDSPAPVFEHAIEPSGQGVHLMSGARWPFAVALLLLSGLVAWLGMRADLFRGAPNKPAAAATSRAATEQLPLTEVRSTAHETTALPLKKKVKRSR